MLSSQMLWPRLCSLWVAFIAPPLGHSSTNPGTCLILPHYPCDVSPARRNVHSSVDTLPRCGSMRDSTKLDGWGPCVATSPGARRGARYLAEAPAEMRLL